MKHLRLYPVLFFCLLAGLLSAQTSPLDSSRYYLGSGMPFEKKFDKVYGYCYDSSDLYPDKCLRIMHQLMDLAEKKKDSLRIARSHFLIGYCYGAKENFVLSLEYYYKGLPYAEMHRDTALMVRIYNNIGIAYSRQLQYKKAIGFFLKVVAIAEKQRDAHTMGVSYNNVAIEYRNLKQYSLADQFLKKSLAIFKDKTQYHSSIVMNRGVIRFERGQYDSALYYYNQGKKLYFTYIDKVLPPNISNNLGELYTRMGNYDSALYYLNYTVSLIDTLNDKYSLREIYKNLADVYERKGNMAKAYYYLKRQSYLSGIIYDNENLKRTLASEANFELLKKDNELLKKSNELKLNQEKQLSDEKQNRLFMIFGAVIGLLLIGALVIAVLRFREKKKANEVLTEQKNRIQEQQTEITDSINYARNIQDSILPTADYLKKILGEYLLFYQPRDIVGGDFYFVEQIGERTYFAVIDCTGHGVPGGFMSIMGFNGIQKCLHDFNLREPAKILDALSEVVVKHFTHQGKQALRDGMDISLCCCYQQNGKTILEFAGANNPAWIVHEKTGQLTELNANKQPIGYFEDRKPFTNHTVELEPGDTIYLFSDGYADQFGGPSGKKFKYSQLKSLLQLNPSITGMKARETLLKATFSAWRSSYEQLDDVCILGVKIS